ncbi:hypothetical protein F0L74_03765 [Chitinophaga agrisoli]|uniref:Uncharacterized protein n=1 Tax=Chitinophaga agrisoli TaxID=2607653 RepID=A0A5B2W2K8_9BACT|nr:hypothetical protein [Chitinophaga agrisoli]KAA2245088.1 hypothetical protein F0L74_03765 [Chitinophaga agrisoli]
MRYLSLLLITAGLSACYTTAVKKRTKEDIQLQAGFMYDRDSVLLVVKEGPGKEEEADRLFLQAIDAYRNKKKAGSSIGLFRQSILLQPQAKAYYEMGNALMDEGNVAEAVKAYAIAETLGYSPLYKVLYNQACAWSRLKNREKAGYYLVSAIEFGYSNLKNIQNDPDLQYLRAETDAFGKIVSNAFSGATDPEKLEWNLFTHEFALLDLPVTLDANYGKKLKGQFISYDYERYVPEMRDGKFSRDVGSDFYYVGLVKGTDSIKTLVYAVRDLSLDEEACPAYYIASFNAYGKLIDKLLIGGHLTLEDPLKVATIQENGVIEVSEFVQRYEKDPKEEGYRDNKIIENKALDQLHYGIADDGRFIKLPELLGMR